MGRHQTICTFVITLVVTIINSKNIDPGRKQGDKSDNENAITEDEESSINLDYVSEDPDIVKNDRNKKDDDDCWVTLDAKEHFKIMDGLDKRYRAARDEYQKAVGTPEVDRNMFQFLINDRGAAPRAVHQAYGDPSKVPAGLNLGGHTMMKVGNIIMFFHRMKLRNETHFQISYIHTNLTDMTLNAHLKLNDLHLTGSYECAWTQENPAILFYRPTYSEMEILLKSVKYNLEGRYRLVQGRLKLELIVSDLYEDGIIMKYKSLNGSQSSIQLQRSDIEQFLVRLRADLDKWFKDYFNDYLMYQKIELADSYPEFQRYDQEKAEALNLYTDNAISTLKERMNQIRASNLALPNFTIFAQNGLEIKLTEGVLRGVDSIHRRSVATGKKVDAVRSVNAVIGFGKLKLEYKYEAQLTNGMPPMAGLFILTADDLVAMMSINMIKKPESVDLRISYLSQAGPEFLTVEGSISKLIANFKHVLENQIVSLMSMTLIHQITLLGSLVNCEPLVVGHADPGEIFSKEVINKKNPGTGVGTGDDDDFSTHEEINYINGTKKRRKRKDKKEYKETKEEIGVQEEKERKRTTPSVGEYEQEKVDSIELAVPSNSEEPKKIKRLTIKQNLK